MDYSEVTNELIKLNITSEAGVYDITDSEIEDKFEKYFDFCQENLLLNGKDLDIEPARFFYQNNFIVNGYAGKDRASGYSVIMIPYGTVEILWTFFTQKNAVLDQENFTKFRGLEANFDTDIVALMFQMATTFTFYHERAHLVQKSHTSHFSFEEIYEQIGNHQNYSIENHVYEFDSDLDAAHFCVMHLLGLWDGMKRENRTLENLHLIMVIGTCSIFVYFIFLLGINDRDIYYHETLHPHPIVRITYIVDFMIRTLNANGVNLDPGLIIREATVLSEAMFVLDGGDNRVRNFAGIFLRESDNIEVYVNELIAASKEFKNLAHTKEQKNKK